MQELSCRAPIFKSVRRRIVFLIGCWTPQLPKGNREVVYKILTELLTDGDLSIRLAAISNLRSVIDDWEFDLDAFQPYTEQIVLILGATLKQTQEFDTQMQVRVIHPWKKRKLSVSTSNLCNKCMAGVCCKSGLGTSEVVEWDS
jgi:hypothetical protein